MPRWNNSLEDNCRAVLDNVIKNLHPRMYQQLLLDALGSNLENNKKVLETYFRSKLGATATLAKHTKQYWSIRGWSAEESYVKSKENKLKNRKSVYSRQTWLGKINPVTGINYTIAEADFERNSRRPIRKEYWIKQGYRESDALVLANEAKLKNNKKGASNSASSGVRNITSKRCVEYYTIRGHSEEEAKDLVSTGQKYFSKEICIGKYGEQEGLKVWKDRQNRWQNSLNSKSEEEKSRINRLKISKGITVSAAERFILNALISIFPNLTHQFTLFESDKKQYIYDIAYNSKIIEYNGDFWHCNPAKYLADFVNPRTKVKAVDKWAEDARKIQFAESQGFKVLVVWESDFKENREKVINECIQFLTQ